MKIVDMHVEDRRNTEEYIEPVPFIRVDEPIQELSAPNRIQGSRFRKVPCGPFTAIEFQVPLGDWKDANRQELANFNVSGLHHEQLTPVIVSHPEEPRLWLMMGVQRVRRLMRQHCQDYTVIVDDLSALNGRLNWYPELIYKVCFHSDCGLTPVKTVWYGGAHVNLCSIHLDTHDDMVRRNKSTR